MVVNCTTTPRDQTVLAQQLEQGLWDGGRVSLTFIPQGVEDEDSKREALPLSQAIWIGKVELRRN
jgi:hypothetical protein